MQKGSYRNEAYTKAYNDELNRKDSIKSITMRNAIILGQKIGGSFIQIFYRDVNGVKARVLVNNNNPSLTTFATQFPVMSTDEFNALPDTLIADEKTSDALCLGESVHEQHAINNIS